MKRSHAAAAAATLLTAATLPATVLAWNALTYQQALNLCARGHQQGCAIAYQYQQRARQQYYGPGSYGSPADNWVSPQELRQGGLRGTRPGVLSTYDLVR